MANSNAPMSDLDMQRRISRQQWNNGKFETLFPFLNMKIDVERILMIYLYRIIMHALNLYFLSLFSCFLNTNIFNSNMFCNADGPNNQSMASISSTNSVIIPGEKAYQHDIKMQMKQ